MRVACPKCKAPYNIPDEKIKPEGSRFKCKKCESPFLVKKPAQPKPAAAPELETISAAEMAMSIQQAPPGRTEAERVERPVEPAATDTQDIQMQGAVAGGGSSTSGPDIPPEHERVPEHLRASYELGKQLAGEEADDRPFMERVPEAFAYPFQPGGWIILISGTILFTLIQFFSAFAGIFGIIGKLFVWGFLAAFLMKNISDTGVGKGDELDWPDVGEFWDDLIHPLLLMLILSAMCYGPGLLVLIGLPILFQSFLMIAVSTFISIPLFIIGGIYFPIGLTAISMARQVSALNPAVLVPSIFRIPLDYLIVCLLLAVIFAVKWMTGIIAGIIPFFGAFAGNLIALYLLVVEARLLGQMYHANRYKLSWLGEVE